MVACSHLAGTMEAALEVSREGMIHLWKLRFTHKGGSSKDIIILRIYEDI